MRKVVDALVEERKWLNQEAYDKLMEMPYGVMEVKDYKNSIKLDKGQAGEVKPADLAAVNIARNIYRPDGNNFMLKCYDKEYPLTPEKYMVIKAAILSSLSTDEGMSEAVWFAVQDWLESSSPRFSEKDRNNSLRTSLYFSTYELLQQTLPMQETCIDSAIGKMSGE